MNDIAKLNLEAQRLEAQRAGRENWRLWGPYLSERAWGTVREDYSEGGTAWEHLDHDQARSRACVMQAMMQMKKIDIAGLRRAYEQP